MLAFEQLKRRLAAEGVFDPARKRRLPRLPRRVGVVTSRTGAVIRDIVNVSRRRFPNVEILLVPVRVQGEGAAVEIAAAIDWLSQSVATPAPSGQALPSLPPTRPALKPQAWQPGTISVAPIGAAGSVDDR